MNAASPLRVAMWSGPRNISTALMRSWGNRDDCAVVDEPLYACYLSATRKPHPGIEEVIAAGQTDWRQVAAQLTGPVPGGKRIYYQKHMTHHLLPEIDRGWLAEFTNCFLIRDPREVLVSYAKIVETPALEDTGFPQQAEIFEYVRRHVGHTPPVIDAADVLRDPRRLLGLLCDALGIEFQESMLAWPPGTRATDGVWAKYWYSEVEKSTGFRPYQPRDITLPPRLQSLYDACRADYDRLYEHRLH
jgi:Sulfotransferase domain